jgi:2-phosphosulfolactate phosphatase
MSELAGAGQDGESVLGPLPAPGATRGVADPSVDPFDQAGFRVRFDWGPMGLRRLAPVADVVVIVDVLSFTTCVDVALGQGAIVFPYRWDNGTESAYAAEHGAELAVPRREVDDEHPWSLSPARLAQIPAGTRLVLPSPNGAALAFAAVAAGTSSVLAACIRNASAVADAVATAPEGVVAVIAAGERWKGTTGPLRPAIEDLLGAGAVIAALGDDALSPEASVAQAAWFAHRDELDSMLVRSGSGRELAGAGYGADVLLAAEVDVSAIAPTLEGPAFVDGRA